MVVTETQSDATIITLSPNRSATWQHTKIVICVMVFIVMVIALAWSFVGAWLILPFAGLEVGLFALLMYKVSKFTYSRQVINIEKEQITISWGQRRLLQTHQLSRQDLYVYYWEADEGWHLPRISLSEASKHVEIGDFLNQEDRELLKNELEQAGLIVCRNKWWQ
ncbi:DUF2244 domain-containing protein [Glaciecola sp. XM2]|uniref:DUF2244 domain-containing protein n=1 Tax=Glaciecola sp. XM2 TaxID=1914931 RepID=UPI001BDE4D9D|nr:DUF2244 domain-containing protein [Glaciecola sp. XM2]MBT1449875.1 DUF2244 domain-containing protein [Glaciecola sp. XM2]